MPKKLEPVHFTEAIDFFRSKVRLPTATWTDLWKEQHARAFVIAGAQKDAMLKDFQGSIAKALEKGTTLDEFRKDFDRIVATHGWQYNGGRAWRSRLIFETNLQMAYSSGRWKQIQAVKKRRPYMRYTALQGGDRRPEHQEWHGTVLPVDDPWWKTHMPINGWGCKCGVQSLSARDVERYGYEIAEEAPAVEMVEHKINTPSGTITRSVPKGIDPGFDYNVGEAAWGSRLSDRAMQDFKQSGEKSWTPLYAKDYRSYGRPVDVPIDKAKAKLGPPAKTEDELKAAASRALGTADDITYTLPDGSPLLINVESLSKHIHPARAPLLPFLPELLEDPFEIWIAFEKHNATGKVVLRKRIIKIVDLPKEGRLIFVANASNGRFEGWTFFKSRSEKTLRGIRYGTLLYGRGEMGPETK